MQRYDSTFYTFALPIERSVCPRPLSPFFPNYCYQFLLGSTIVPKGTEKNIRMQDFGEQTERIMSSAEMVNSMNS